MCTHACTGMFRGNGYHGYSVICIHATLTPIVSGDHVRVFITMIINIIFKFEIQSHLIYIFNKVANVI